MMRFMAVWLAALVLAAPAAAQSYPTETIRIVVPFAAGAAVDIVARMAADWIARQTGKPVVVENRTGAGGLIAMEHVASAKPDGHTLLVTADGPITVTYLLSKTAKVNPSADFAPVARIADIITILAVNSKVPATTLEEFVAHARANPGKINYASAGPGTTQHMAMAHLGQLAGADLVHVPYRGVAAAIPDLVTGNVQAIATGYGILLPHVQSGAVRFLAAGSTERPSYRPDLRTGAEQGYPDWEFTTWVGMYAPKGTPAPLIEQLNGYIRSLMADPATQKRLSESYFTPSSMNVPDFTRFVTDRIERGRRLVKELKIQSN